MLNMGGSQKSKRVSWASDVNLCQVRLFLSDESPSQVGQGTQDHLQPKVTRPTSFVGNGSDDNLPPGFEGMQPVNQWNAKQSQIPVINWKCPPRFKLNTEWHVVAGEESKEIEAETLRQAKMLEAIYPRVSAIPPNPSGPNVAEKVNYNDQNILLVPLTSVEEEDAALDTSSLGFASTNISSMTSQPRSTTTQVATSYPGNSSSMNPQVTTASSSSSSALDPNILASLQAAFSMYTSSPSQGNLIDQDLLMKILSNPNSVEELLKKLGASSSSSQSMPVSGAQTGAPQHIPSSSESSIVHNRPAFSTQYVTSSSMQSMPMSTTHNMPSPTAQFGSNLRSQAPSSFDQGHTSRQEHVTPSWAPANLPFNPQSRIGSSSMPSVRPPQPIPEVSAPMNKDINYYKSLIQQHGGERRETSGLYSSHQGQQTTFGTNQEVNNVMRSRDSKHKIMKPCMYFNTPRGCRNGANCSFQHDPSSQTQQRVGGGGGGSEVPNAKRMKMDREITGT